MRLTQLFVNRPPLVFVLLALVGTFSLATLVQQQFPNIDFPTVNISVSYPGASPSELRDAVVRPLEDAIAGAPDLDHITTSIQQNQASISATFTLDSNQTTDLTSVQDRIQTAQSALPVDLPAPSVRTFDPAQAVVVTLSLTSNSLTVERLSAIVTNDIVPALEQVDGISSVGANGTVTPALEVTVDPAKLAGFGYTPNDVVSAIQSNNVRAPGGIAYSSNRETSIDIRGDVTTPQSIADLLLSGSTAVLTGATSPSGTLTQKYNSVTGATNQALALGSATSAASSSSASLGGAVAGLPSLSSASATLAAATTGSSATGGTTSGASAGATAAGGGANAASAGASAASSAAGASSATGTTTASAGATISVTTPAPTTTPVAAPTVPTTTIGTTTTTTTGGAAGAGGVSSAVTPQPAATANAAGAASTLSTPVPSPTATASSAAGALAAGGGTSGTSTATGSAASTSAATTSTSTSTSTSIAALSGGSGSASSGAASSATNPFSTSARLPRIGDVATVTDYYEPKRVSSYVNGKYAITLNVQKATGASEVTSSENVIAALPALEAQYPDIDFHVLNVQADETKAQLFGVLQTLIEGIVFTGIAMLFFLRSWRNALVVMIAIPASLLVTFFVMRLANYTIDTVSLLAMTLIIGILVDDSIVVLENVERHYENGEAPRTAAILGRTEIGAAAVVITLVDVVVFLPIAFLPGQTGRFLGEFGVVVTIATLTSLAVSFTITPSLAGNWSLLSGWRPPGIVLGFADNFARLRNFYSERILMRAFRHPIVVVGLSALLTAGAIALIPLGFVGFEFIPSVDRGQIFVGIQFPTGTPLATTDAAVRALTNAYLQLGDVATITSTSGTSQAGFGGSVNLGSNGQLRVFLSPNHKQSTDTVARIMTGIGRRVVPGAKVTAIPATGTRGGNSQPIDITVSTTRGEPDAYAVRVLQALEDTPGTANVNSSALQLAPQIDIEFNRDRARALNLDIGAAALAVKAAFGGALATQFDSANGTKYVQVLYPFADQTSLATLNGIALRTLTGSIVHLGDVAILQNDPAQALITRNNRQTVIHISSNVASGAALSNVQSAFKTRLAALHLPNTVMVGTGAGGTQQNLTQTINGLSVSLILSFALVFLLMIALYDAYRAPLVIMFAIPVAAIGAFGSLAITGQSLNLYSLIGVVMLVGLVSKNGILLVDFAQLKVLGGLDKLSAIKQAARERFRPIVMTTSSMIAGMLPLALAIDPGSAAKRSLGTVVIGGLTSSLLLTLILVPVVYLWIAPGPPQDRAGAGLGLDGALARQPLESR
jgi:HAE1 family hydrophobic/amphiphilic exporter-1